MPDAHKLTSRQQIIDFVQQELELPTSDPEKWVEQVVPMTREFLKNWTDDPFVKEEFFEKPKAILDQFLKKPETHFNSQVPMAVSTMMFWHQNHGARRVMEGDENGWSEIGTSWKLIELYATIESRIVHEEEFKAALGLSYPENTPSYQQHNLRWAPLQNYIGIAMCGFLATGEYKSARKLSEYAFYLAGVNSIHTNNYHAIPIRLTHKLLGIPESEPEIKSKLARDVSTKWEKFGKDLFINWDIPNEKFQKTLIKYFYLPEKYDDSSFLRSEPWWICPILVIAICRVREAMKFKTSLPEHPLMTSPLAKMPATFETNNLNWIIEIDKAISLVTLTPKNNQKLQSKSEQLRKLEDKIELTQVYLNNRGYSVSELYSITSKHYHANANLYYHLADDLVHYAKGLITEGCLKLHDREGWLLIRRGCRYIYLANLLHTVRLYFKGIVTGDQCKLPKDTATALFGSLLLKDNDITRWTALHLKKFGNNNSLIPGAFACALEALLNKDTKRIKSIKSTDLDVYLGIIRTWEGAPDQSKTIEKALDYHAKNAEGYDPPFEGGFQNVWPMEINAMRQVRQQLGLDMPEVSHFYTETPYWDAMPPDDLPPFKDALYDGIFKAYIPEGFEEYSLEQLDKRKSLEPSPSKKEMTLDEFEQSLFDGKTEEAMHYQECTFIDWSDDPFAIIGYFNKQLPGGALTNKRVPRNDKKLAVSYNGTEKKLTMMDKGQAVALPFLKSLAKLVRPDYDTRIFKSTMNSDTIGILTKEKAWWDKMEKTNKKAVQKMFKKY